MLRKPTFFTKKPVPLKTVTLKQILDDLTSNARTDPYVIIKKYLKTHFHLRNQFGILRKKSEEHYVLFIYQKPDRTKGDFTKEQVNVSFDDKGCIQAVPHKELDHLVVLVQNKTEWHPFYWSQTLQLKEKKPVLVSNPYHHDHLVYLSFMDNLYGQRAIANFTKQWLSLRDQFGLPPSTLQVIQFKQIQDMALLQKKIRKKKVSRILKTGTVYIVLDAHCFSGGHYLTGEYVDEKKKVVDVRWSTYKVVSILKLLRIPSQTLIDIDVYACKAGSGSTASPAFCQLLINAVRQAGWLNVSVKGNLNVVYISQGKGPYPEYVMSQTNQDTVTFGALREPLSAVSSLKNTETYLSIMQYPVDEKETERNSAILALKQQAKKSVAQSQESLAFDQVHASLAKKWLAFKNLDHFISTLREEIMAMKARNSADKNYQGMIELLEKHRVHAYIESSKTLDYASILDYLKKHHRAITAKSRCILKIEEYKKHLIRGRMSLLEDNRHIDHQLRLIKAAETGTISYTKAWEILQKPRRVLEVEEALAVIDNADKSTPHPRLPPLWGKARMGGAFVSVINTPRWHDLSN